MKKNYDIIIIGNGLVGAATACALASLNLSIAIIDKNPLVKISAKKSVIDGRKIALSFASYKILQEFNVWPTLKTTATPIKQVHVSQKGTFGSTRINAEDVNADKLGYVIPADDLGQALRHTLDTQTNVDYICPANVTEINLEKTPTLTYEQTGQSHQLTANLIIAADGALSPSRTLLNIPVNEKDYQQTALVTSVNINSNMENIAYQRLLDDAVLAMLPMQQQTYAVVYTASHKKISNLMQQTDALLLKSLQQDFGYRLGHLRNLGVRFTYPLKQIIATQQTLAGFLLLGNAAHNLTPVAAQGFKLALQDIYCFKKLLTEYNNDYSLALTEYQHQRKAEQQRIITFTDRLMQWSKTNKSSRVFNAMALTALDLAPKMKQKITTLGMGLTPQIQLLMRATNAK